MNLRQRSSRYGAGVQFAAGLCAFFLLAAAVSAGFRPGFEIWLACALVVSVILHARAGFALSRAQQEIDLMRNLAKKVEPDSSSIFSTSDLEASPEGGVSEDDAKSLRAVRDAIEKDRIDLYFQPVVQLPKRETVFFEAFSRLRNADGGVLQPYEYVDAAQRANRIGVIDNMIMLRSVLALRNLGPGAKRYRIFCNISPATIFDSDFFARFTDYLDANADLAPQLIFEFTFPMIEMLHERVSRNLEAIAERGYVFSVDHIRRLDHDWTDLSARHFKYVKVASSLLLSEMRAGETGRARVGAFKKNLDAAGIQLVVEKVEFENQLSELLSDGPIYAQGELFGAPRPVGEYLPTRSARNKKALRKTLLARAS